MNIKKNYKILAIILVGFIVLSIVIFNIPKEDEDRKYTLLENYIVTSTLTQTINEATTQKEKGPVLLPQKIAYITIDDGPSKYTNSILDILEKNQVKATFFMINDNMKKHPDELNRMQKEGHGMGFHSVTHDIHKLYETPQATLNEFKTCQETLYNITGDVSKLIRLPYGSKPYMPKESYDMLVENNYKIWDWNLDTLDWKSTTDNILSSLLYYGRNKSNLIVLMHEKEQTVEALDNIIRVLKERGYKIEPISEDTQDRNYWKGNVQS